MGAGRRGRRPTRGRAGALLAAAAGTALLAAAPGLASTSISTVAGGGTQTDDGAPATLTSLNTPAGVRAVANGFVVAEQGRYRVRRVQIADISTEDTGTIDTIAGSGNPGTGQAVLDGAATAVSMNLPCCLSLTASGKLLVADTLGGMVWRVNGPRIETVAGTGAPSSCQPTPPAEIAAKSAALCFVVGVGAAPGAERFLIAEDGLPDQSRSGGARIYEVDETGVLHIVAGGGCPNGNPAAGPLGLCIKNPRGPAYTGNSSAPTEFVFADRGRNVVWKVSSTSPATAAATMIAGTGEATAADQSNLGDGGPAGQATLSGPSDLSITPSRGLLIADRDNCRVRRVAALAASATITSLAGTSCGATDDRALAYPQAVAFSPGGILISESVGGRVRLVQRTAIADGPTGGVTTADATFSFESVEPGAEFRCSLDGQLSSCSSPLVLTGLTDGAHTFSVYDEHPPADPSPARRSWVVDTTPPDQVDLLAPAVDATDLSPRPRFRWTAGHDATSGIDHYDLMVDDAVRATLTAAACTDVCQAQPSAPLSEGVHRWRVRVVDAVGLTRESYSHTLVVGSDPVARLSFAPNPVLVGNPVGIDASASSDEGGPITRYEWDLDGNGTFEFDTGTRPFIARSFPVAGQVRVSVRVTDAVGKTAVATETLRVNDPPGAPRLYGVSVDHGALFTNSPDVTLNLVYPGSTTGVVMSNDGGFLTAMALDPSPQMRWRLASAGPERLPKTVYVQFLSGPFATDRFSDDIILDETRPSIVSATVRPAAPSQPPTSSAASPARTSAGSRLLAKTLVQARGSRMLRVRARDNASGVTGIQVSVGVRASRARFRPFGRAPVTVRTAGKIWVRVRDGAGNVSKWKSVR